MRQKKAFRYGAWLDGAEIWVDFRIDFGKKQNSTLRKRLGWERGNSFQRGNSSLSRVVSFTTERGGWVGGTQLTNILSGSMPSQPERDTH